MFYQKPFWFRSGMFCAGIVVIFFVALMLKFIIEEILGNGFGEIGIFIIVIFLPIYMIVGGLIAFGVGAIIGKIIERKK